MGLATGEIAGAAIFADGVGAQASDPALPRRLRSGRSSTSRCPKLADYREKVTLFFDDRIFELRFPSPYLNHQPTELIEKRSEGLHLQTIVAPSFLS